MSAQEPLLVNRWYLPQECSAQRPRWLLAVGARHCIYSRGGEKHYECTIKTFHAWRVRYKADPA